MPCCSVSASLSEPFWIVLNGTNTVWGANSVGSQVILVEKKNFDFTQLWYWDNYNSGLVNVGIGEGFCVAISDGCKLGANLIIFDCGDEALVPLRGWSTNEQWAWAQPLPNLIENFCNSYYCAANSGGTLISAQCQSGSQDQVWGLVALNESTKTL